MITCCKFDTPLLGRKPVPRVCMASKVVPCLFKTNSSYFPLTIRGQFNITCKKRGIQWKFKWHSPSFPLRSPKIPYKYKSNGNSRSEKKKSLSPPVPSSSRHLIKKISNPPKVAPPRSSHAAILELGRDQEHKPRPPPQWEQWTDQRIPTHGGWSAMRCVYKPPEHWHEEDLLRAALPVPLPSGYQELSRQQEHEAWGPAVWQHRPGDPRLQGRCGSALPPLLPVDLLPARARPHDGDEEESDTHLLRRQAVSATRCKQGVDLLESRPQEIQLGPRGSSENRGTHLRPLTTVRIPDQLRSHFFLVRQSYRDGTAHIYLHRTNVMNILCIQGLVGVTEGCIECSDKELDGGWRRWKLASEHLKSHCEEAQLIKLIDWQSNL